MSRILADTGPLVAIVARHDPYHQRCAAQLEKIDPPLLVCWPVITEAAWLLRAYPQGIPRLVAAFHNGMLRLIELDEQALPFIASFLDRYRNVGAQLADAALMYLAERDGLDTVFTLDRRDFSVYRLPGGRALNLLP